MSFKFSNIVQYFEYLPFVDDVVAIVHDVSDADSTADKAADVIEDVIGAVEKYLSKTNPVLALEIATVYAVLKPELDKLKDKPASPFSETSV